MALPVVKTFADKCGDPDQTIWNKEKGGKVRTTKCPLLTYQKWMQGEEKIVGIKDIRDR